MLLHFEELAGHTLRNCYTRDAAELVFVLQDGTAYKLHHEQDCCENVYIEDICGALTNLIDVPLHLVEESSSDVPQDNGEHPDDLRCWTFYKLATFKGYVTVRWYGGSNGYYSVNVDFDRAAAYDEKISTNVDFAADGPDVG